MKPLHFIIPLITFLTGILSATPPPTAAWANEDSALPKPHDKNIRYVFGSLNRHTQLIHQLIDLNEQNEPFSDQLPNHTPSYDKLAPLLTRQQIPHCLPPFGDFRDITKTFNQWGLTPQDGSWILYSETAGQLLFCLSLSDADILEQITTGLTPRRPRSINQRITVVSVENRSLKNQPAWSLKTLKALSPITHARYGVSNRSGEKSDHQIRQTSETTLASYEVETTVGESDKIYDCRLDFQCELSGVNPIKLNTKTSYTANIGQPFIIDCGIHGDKQRNYLLIIDSHSLPIPPSPYGVTVYNYLQKIDGIYSLRSNPKDAPLTDPPTPISTRTYHSPPRLLEQLRDLVLSVQYTAIEDPFSDNPPKRLPPPIQVLNLKETKHHLPSDTVFDITPQLNTLGLNPFKNEWIYYNATQKRLLIHGCPLTHKNTFTLIDRITFARKMIQVRAHIVSVKSNESAPPIWSMNIITQHQPKMLATYSNISHSGEKASSGDPTLLTDESWASEFETEPILGIDGQHLDLLFHLKTHALSEDKISHQISSALSLQDGKPSIIEIGHPTSATHTHLLIINPDIITTDGRFYRDRFKPLNP